MHIIYNNRCTVFNGLSFNTSPLGWEVRLTHYLGLTKK